MEVFAIFQNTSVLRISEGNLCLRHVVQREKQALIFFLWLALFNNWWCQGNTILMKKLKKLRSHLQIYKWHNLPFWPIAKDSVLKLSVSQLPKLSFTFKRLQQFIVISTWPQSYTVAFNQYTAFLKHNMLHFLLKTAGFVVQLTKFPYTVPRKNLWTGT